MLYLLRSILLLLLRPGRRAVCALLLRRTVSPGLLLTRETLLPPILLLGLSAVASTHWLLLGAVTTHWLPHRTLLGLSAISAGLLAITATGLLAKALLATRSRVGAGLSARARLRAVAARRLLTEALLILLGREALLRRRNACVLRRGLRSLGVAAWLRGSCEIACEPLCHVNLRTARSSAPSESWMTMCRTAGGHAMNIRMKMVNASYGPAHLLLKPEHSEKAERWVQQGLERPRLLKSLMQAPWRL